MRWHFEIGESHSKSKNSPFTGRSLKSKNIVTIYKGKIVYFDKERAPKRVQEVLAGTI